MKPILFLLAASMLFAQQPTHVAMDALLNIRFFPSQGSFMMAESVPVLFPPPGETKARLVIKDASGKAVVTKDMVIEPWPPHNAFGNLRPANGLAGFGPIGEGDFTMSVEMNGKTISAYSFSTKAEKGGDPFDPKNELVRSGPWSQYAFLIGPTGSDRPVGVGIWLNTRELPGYAPKKQIPYTLHLLKAGKQVGLVEGVVTFGHWELFKPEVRQGHGLGPVYWSALMAQPGAYTLELRAGGKTIRTYGFQIANGQVSRIPSNELGYAGPDALPPQSLTADTRILEFWMLPR